MEVIVLEILIMIANLYAFSVLPSGGTMFKLHDGQVEPSEVELS